MDNSGPVDVQEFKRAEKAKRSAAPPSHSYPFRVRSSDSRLSSKITSVPDAYSGCGSTWGYRPKSSGALQTIAALKAYGLLEDVAGNDERKVQLTDAANRLLRDSRPGVRDREIRQSALRPRLFGEYAERWGSDRPSDAHRISELHLDRGFTEEAARTFIKVFDESLSYAGLDKIDKHIGAKPDNELTNAAATSGVQPDNESEMCGQGYQDNLQKTDSWPEGLPDRATFPLPEGLVQLEVPAQLSQASYRTWRRGWRL